MFFKRVIIALFGFFAAFMLFVFIVRLANNKQGFLGFSDLFNYFGSGDLDLGKPVNDFVNNLKNVFNDFSDIIESAKHINSFVDVLFIIAKLFVQAIKLIAFPVIVIFEIIKLVVSYFIIFGNFINWIISFEGWIPAS